MTNDRFDRLKVLLERILMTIVVTAAIGTFVGALAIIIGMDAASDSQGGRFFVAIGATVMLGWLETQAARVVERRAPWILTEPERVRKYRIWSLSLLFLAVVGLFSAALFLP